jgi:AcrR family transcriptional regulator
VAEPSPARRPPVWLRPGTPPAPSGPGGPLNLHRIVAAAVAIADAEGVDAVSMRRVAGELGSGTMSLYRHVATKNELLDLMVDEVVDECWPAEPPTGRWRADLRAMAMVERQVMLRHPWMVPLVASRPPLGRNVLRRTEYMLGLVDGLGLSIDQMAGFVGVVSAYVRGVVFTHLATAEEQRRSGMDEDAWRGAAGPYLRELVAGGGFPLVRRFMIEADDHPDPEKLFEDGLDCVLDGLETRLERLGRNPQGRAEPPES